MGITVPTLLKSKFRALTYVKVIYKENTISRPECILFVSLSKSPGMLIDVSGFSEVRKIYFCLGQYSKSLWKLWLFYFLDSQGFE